MDLQRSITQLHLVTNGVTTELNDLRVQIEDDFPQNERVVSQMIHSQSNLRDQSNRDIQEIQEILSIVEDETYDPIVTPSPRGSPLLTPQAPRRITHSLLTPRSPRPVTPTPTSHSIHVASVEDHNNAIQKFQGMIDSISSGEEYTLNEGEYLVLSNMLSKWYISSN